MARDSWKTALVVLAALIAGALLGGRGLAPQARAQTVGGSGPLIAVVGQGRGADVPVLLVDTNEQSAMIYEYDMGSNRLDLTAVRSFRYDRLLVDWYGTNRPSVEDVRKAVESQGPRR